MYLNQSTNKYNMSPDITLTNDISNSMQSLRNLKLTHMDSEVDLNPSIGGSGCDESIISPAAFVSRRPGQLGGS